MTTSPDHPTSRHCWAVFRFIICCLPADFIEDTVKPFLKANDKSFSWLSYLDETDKNGESDTDGTVIIALGEEKNFGVLLQVFDFKNEKWIPLMKKPEYGYQGMIPRTGKQDFLR